MDNEHLNIGVTEVQYDIEYEEGELKDKEGVLYSVRASSVQPLKHWAWLLYEPAKEPDSIGHFFPIPHIILVLSKD